MKAIKVYGKVQGVFFRKNTQQKADELNLKGFVQNMDDGSVYIEAEGTKEADLVSWIKGSPDQAKVENVETQELENRNYETFEIRE